MTEATFEERLAAFEVRLQSTERDLRARVDAVEADNNRLAHERDEYKKLAGLLQEQVERLKRGLLGQKAERLPKNDAQLSLAILNLALGGDATAAAEPPSDPVVQTVPEHQRRKPVRKPFPDDLPRVDVDIVPVEVEVEGVENFELVGENSREVMERRPASAVIVTLHYKKFLRKARDRAAEATEMLMAPAVELPIERGVAGPSLLADTIVRRWQDHQPLSRLEDIYNREKLGLPKSTICTWHEYLAELVRPVVDAMFQDAYRQPYLCRRKKNRGRARGGSLPTRGRAQGPERRRLDAGARRRWALPPRLANESRAARDCTSRRARREASDDQSAASRHLFCGRLRVDARSLMGRASTSSTLKRPNPRRFASTAKTLPHTLDRPNDLRHRGTGLFVPDGETTTH